MQLLLQFFADFFETSHVFWTWLKICMWCGYNPQIIFYHFFRKLNFAIFQAFYYQSEWLVGTLCAQLLLQFYINSFFYAPAIRRMRKGIKRCPCPSVRPCVRPSVCASLCASVRPSFKWVLCERNSSYNFIPILLKLYRCFCQGLKMCMTFGYNPQINFCHFFHSLNLVIFGLNYY